MITPRRMAMLTLITLIGLASGLMAQESEVLSAEVEFRSILSISVLSNEVDFGTPVLTDFLDGWKTAASGTVVSHFGNVPHSIEIQATSEYMSALLPANDGKRLMSGIEWQAVINGGAPSAWTPLNHLAPVEIDDFSAGEYEDWIVLSYRLKLDADFAPDTYSGSWTLTIVEE